MLKNHLRLTFILLLIISLPDVSLCGSKLFVGNKNKSIDSSQLHANGGNASELQQHTDNIVKQNETQNHLQESSSTVLRLNSTKNPVKIHSTNIEIKLNNIGTEHTTSSETAMLNNNSPTKLSSSFAIGNSSKIRKENSTASEENEVANYDCSQIKVKEENGNNNSANFCYSPSASLLCYQDPIFCETYHLSGKRELKWPAYGEYSYLSHKHWVKILQHGGVVFLYHPCVNHSTVNKLRTLAESCMLRFVLTPCEKLSLDKQQHQFCYHCGRMLQSFRGTRAQEERHNRDRDNRDNNQPFTPLALVSWGCFLLMNSVDYTECKLWIKSHAYKGPASHVHKNGTYEEKLVKAAKILTDIKDTFLCPDEEEKAFLQTTIQPVTAQHKVNHKHVGEELILTRLAKAKHKIKTHKSEVERFPVDTKKALSAFGSLVFICVLLLLLMLYTKLWNPKLRNSKYRYEKLGDVDMESEYNYDNSNFSLLKTSQDFISSLRRGKRERRLDSHHKVNLLTPITEEEDAM